MELFYCVRSQTNRIKLINCKHNFKVLSVSFHRSLDQHRESRIEMYLIIALITLCFLGYLLNQHHHTYWAKLGFPQLSPRFLVGDIGPRLIPKSSLGEFFQTLYQKNKHQAAVGVYMSYSPVLLITDTILLQKVFISDFSSFHDRPIPFDLDNEPLAAHLFNLQGQKWRDLRVKLSPTFTSGKIKVSGLLYSEFFTSWKLS